jgi:hypothetical protein
VRRRDPARGRRLSTASTSATARGASGSS